MRKYSGKKKPKMLPDLEHPLEQDVSRAKTIACVKRGVKTLQTIRLGNGPSQSIEFVMEQIIKIL